MKKFLFLAVALIGLMSSCGHKEYPAVGDTHIKVFDKANVCFQPGKYENFTEALIQTGAVGNAYLDAPSCIRSCLWVPFFL